MSGRAAAKRQQAAPAIPQRRTQQERRESTIARLLDATIESLLETGYAGTSIKEICDRAGVSQGGLFRHFDSRLAVIMAAAEEVAQRQIANAEKGFARSGTWNEPLVDILYGLRDACRKPINAVFYELVVAARTDAELRRAMASFGARYASAIEASAMRIPAVAQLPADLRPVLISSLLHLFDGEALTRTVLSFPQYEEQRMELLIHLAKALTAGSTAIPPKQAGKRGRRGG